MAESVSSNFVSWILCLHKLCSIKPRFLVACSFVPTKGIIFILKKCRCCTAKKKWTAFLSYYLVMHGISQSYKKCIHNDRHTIIFYEKLPSVAICSTRKLKPKSYRHPSANAVPENHMNSHNLNITLLEDLLHYLAG